MPEIIGFSKTTNPRTKTLDLRLPQRVSLSGSTAFASNGWGRCPPRSRSRGSQNCNVSRFAADGIEEVCPILQHCTPRSEIFGSIVCSANFVLFAVCQLQFDPVFMISADPHRWFADLDQLLIRPGARQTPEAVNSLSPVVTEPIEAIDHRILGKRHLGLLAWKDVFAFGLADHFFG